MLASGFEEIATRRRPVSSTASSAEGLMSFAGCSDHA
jgi:hypothetical protein